MASRINPFTPHEPTRPGSFIGRRKEIEELEAALSHTQRGRLRHFLITGDRGVGKTSFLDFIRQAARSHDQERTTQFNFIVVDLVIDRNTTKLSLIKRIERALNYELARTEPAREFLKQAWGFVRRIEAAGVRVR